MILARQSTARTVTVGPVLDADGAAVTDGVVGDFKISKNGGAPATLDGSATLTHRATGHYSLSLTASDLDTVGQAEIIIDDTTNACPVKEITVVEEAVYDALFAAGAAGYQVPIWAAANSTVNLSGTTVGTVSALAAGSITASVIATGAIDADALATDGVQEIRDAITGGAYALSTDANGRVRIVDGTAAGELDTNAGTVTVGTNNDKTGYRLSAAGVDDIWDEPQSGHATAGTFGLYLDAAISGVSTGGVSAADIADAVWDEATSGHVTAGTFGKLAADVLDDTGTSGVAVASLAANSVTAAALAADAVAEIQSGLSTLDAAAVRSAVGLASANLDTQLASIDDYIDTEIATILSRIGVPVTSLAADLAALNDLSAAEVNAEVDAALADVGLTTTVTGRIDAAVSTRSTVTTAQVNAEVVDALATDTYAEPGQGAPAATATLAAKINYLFKAWRNKKTQTADTFSLYADDGVTVDQKSTVSDDGTTSTFGEMVTGA